MAPHYRVLRLSALAAFVTDGPSCSLPSLSAPVPSAPAFAASSPGSRCKPSVLLYEPAA